MNKSGILLGLALIVNSRISIDTSTRTFRDDFGRSRLFHGFNAVYKSAPYIPITDHFDP
jgi:hypothetical protein